MPQAVVLPQAPRLSRISLIRAPLWRWGNFLICRSACLETQNRGEMEVFWNGGFPRSSMLIRVSFIKQPFGGTPMTMGTSKWLVKWLVTGWLCCHLRWCYHTDLDMIPVVFPWHREAMNRSNAFHSGQGEGTSMDQPNLFHEFPVMIPSGKLT